MARLAACATKAGARLSSGADAVEVQRQPASSVAKTLNGAKPDNLSTSPHPTLFRLVITLQTAKVLRPTIPPSLLQQADQVIDQ